MNPLLPPKLESKREDCPTPSLLLFPLSSSLSFLQELDGVMDEIQCTLFELGSHVATPRDANTSEELRAMTAFRDGPARVAQLEHLIYALDDRLPPLSSFILPAGDAATTAVVRLPKIEDNCSLLCSLVSFSFLLHGLHFHAFSFFLHAHFVLFFYFSFFLLLFFLFFLLFLLVFR